MQPENGRRIIEQMRKIIERNEQKLAYFHNRLKQAEFMDRPNRRMISAAGEQASSYTDQLMTLRLQLRELERLYGESVKLRTTEERDLRLIWRWTNEPVLSKILRTESMTFRAYIDNWHRWLADDDMYPFSIDLANGQLLGFLLVSCVGKAWETRHASLEFMIIRPDYRYRGYGAEALADAIDFAFEQLGVETFVLQVDADNEAALRCFEKCGLRCVELETVSSGTGDGSSDRYRMELSREVWENGDSETTEIAEANAHRIDVAQSSRYPGVTLFTPLKDLLPNG